VLRITLATEPFAGLGWQLAIPTAALGAFAAWTLASGTWSDAPARALIEFDRGLMYWLALVLFGSFARRPDRLAWGVRGVAAAIVAVCALALLTRVLPDAAPAASEFDPSRLAYPLTYWNALGLLAALGAALALHLASSERERAPVRVLAAGALPVVAATLYFTFSRGAIAALLVAAVAYVVLARPRGLAAALLSAGPAAGVTIAAAYGSQRLSSANPTSSAALDEGAASRS
jgi:hypothetical protein